jgi:hypothetical protein
MLSFYVYMPGVAVVPGVSDVTAAALGKAMITQVFVWEDTQMFSLSLSLSLSLSCLLALALALSFSLSYIHMHGATPLLL